MKNFLLALALALLPLGTFAQSTYNTTNGTVNLAAGLTDLTSFSAINTTNQSVGIDFITDSSWSTGIANLGITADDFFTPNNGTLAGSFGGGTYYAGQNSIILIGTASPTLRTNTFWGGWTIRLLLSDSTYSSPFSYNDSNLILNPGELTATNASRYSNPSAATISYSTNVTAYQLIDIAAFDPGNIGVIGIEMTAMTQQFPDINYIGVTGVVPEPSTFALLAFSAATLGGYALRRRR